MSPSSTADTRGHSRHGYGQLLVRGDLIVPGPALLCPGLSFNRSRKWAPRYGQEGRRPCYGSAVSSTRIRRHINAPRAAVYRALLDANAVARWMVPSGMNSHVHAFDPREGGAFRISLTYDAPTGTGKTTPHTDTYHGRFVELVQNEHVVEVVEFETEDPTLQGEMTITFTLTDADSGTEVFAVHDRLPPGLSPADNETGWRSSLANLAALVEAGEEPCDQTPK
jgi:uncharacterized protein YndB with AHSA1/START domain